MSLSILQPDETIIHVIHRHWFYLLKETIGFFLVAFVPLIVVVLGVSFGVGAYIPGNTILLFVAGFFVWFLYLLPAVMVTWADYHLDMLFITNKRVIAIEQKGLFSREISSFRYERIQDITIEVHGILATFLNFGTIHIQTAGDNRDFLIEYIPTPQRVKDAAFREYDKVVRRGGVGIL